MASLNPECRENRIYMTLNRMFGWVHCVGAKPGIMTQAPRFSWSDPISPRTSLEVVAMVNQSLRKSKLATARATHSIVQPPHRDSLACAKRFVILKASRTAKNSTCFLIQKCEIYVLTLFFYHSSHIHPHTHAPSPDCCEDLRARRTHGCVETDSKDMRRLESLISSLRMRS